MGKQNENVVILGASDKEERYSYKALKMLEEHGHRPFPVHPGLGEIEGHKCYKDLKEAKEAAGEVDTLTMYVNSKISTGLTDDILALKPGRVIFNPGTENDELEEKLASSGVGVERACTLVLLRTAQY